ncbi:MAG: phosphate ABC transporter permease subunit PstC [Desulfobulbaceae bacterium]|uniref:Phosphate transport system permease protein n=1 Tax=Candidatus Desulfobia pelagia TaxID=2841692 RepID=A0A8J6N9K8_9BACT|nr:phosphate ABC transporter permease subunit PstC [Candidatus Desulfobia pelagia]
MSTTFIISLLLGLSIAGYFFGYRRSITLASPIGGVKNLHSRPAYYGMLVALWCGLPTFIIFLVWQSLEPSIISSLMIADLPLDYQNLPKNQLGLIINDIKNLATGNIVAGEKNAIMHAAANHYVQLQILSKWIKGGALLVLGLITLIIVCRRITPEQRARNHVEKIIRIVLFCCSTIAILTTLGIILSVLFESIRFFKAVPITDFLFGLKWSPQTAIRADQVGSSGAFGAVPVFIGTMMISAIALFIAVPIGLMSAIYLSEYAGKKFRTIAKPLLEILAGIPTVVYGFFAALSVAPFIRQTGGLLGLDVSSESALAAGLVMGIMIIPFVSSLSDDVINAVPQSLRDGSYALGATRSETIRNVVVPAALPGIIGGILLAASRAIGETMIVVMAAGLSARLTANPLETVTTITVQIVTLLVGDQEFDSPKTLAAFALGLLLFVATLILNVIALVVVRKYREQYE